MSHEYRSKRKVRHLYSKSENLPWAYHHFCFFILMAKIYYRNLLRILRFIKDAQLDHKGKRPKWNMEDSMCKGHDFFCFWNFEHALYSSWNEIFLPCLSGEFLVILHDLAQASPPFWSLVSLFLHPKEGLLSLANSSQSILISFGNGYYVFTTR